LRHCQGSVVVSTDQRWHILIKKSELHVEVPEPARFARSLGECNIFRLSQGKRDGILLSRAPGDCSFASQKYVSGDGSIFVRVAIGSICVAREEVGVIRKCFVCDAVSPSTREIAQDSL